MSLRPPILWRYLSSQFLKVFLFTLVALIGGLLTLRLEEIASFAALDPTGTYLLSFIAYQIPYILPIALPLACLISSIILMKRLSSTHEIAALRALSFSLGTLFAPVLIIAFILSIANFLITSEVATATHLKTNILKSELRSINPLLLLQNKHLLKTKGIFFEALGTYKMGESASKVVIAFPGKKGERLSLVLADELHTEGAHLSGKGITLITPQDKREQVIVENIGGTTSQIEDFSELIKSKVTSVSDEQLNLKHLILKMHETRSDSSSRPYAKALTELFRRLSLGFAPFSFTLMGLAFGLSISRRDSKKGLIFATLLATVFLTTFFLAKGAAQRPEAAFFLYFTPHLLILLASLLYIRQISRGIE
jgi:lipopolysaccharide export system permease protein